MSGLELARTWLLGALLAWCMSGCGYRMAHAEPDPLGPFEVRAGTLSSPGAEARIAALGGARSMLARHGQLASPSSGAVGSGQATSIVIDIVRIEEHAAAISADEADASPDARSVRMTITGRARMHLGAHTIRDTGDVDVDELVSPAGDAASFELARDEAVRVASQRLGQTLVRRLLLLP